MIKRSAVAVVLAGLVVGLACKGAVTVSDATPATAPAASTAAATSHAVPVPNLAVLGVVPYEKIVGVVPLEGFAFMGFRAPDAVRAVGTDAIMKAWGGKRITLEVKVSPAWRSGIWLVQSYPTVMQSHGMTIICAALFKIRDGVPASDLVLKEGQTVSIRGTVVEATWGTPLHGPNIVARGVSRPGPDGPGMRLTLEDCVIGKAAEAELRASR